jgi:hypothetical protein
MELSAAGEDSTTTSVVLEGPLQVYKKENEEVMAVSKEPKRKSKVKKSKSKGKKVHLFRDGFTLPSAEEQEDDSDSGVVGMAHGDWSGQVLSSLTSELLAEFPPLSAGGSSVLTNPKSTVFTPLAVLKERSLLVDPEHQVHSYRHDYSCAPQTRDMHSCTCFAWSLVEEICDAI